MFAIAGVEGEAAVDNYDIIITTILLQLPNWKNYK